MRNRRTFVVYGAALALLTGSLALMSISPRSIASIPASGWRITVYHNGRPIRSTLHEQLPSDFGPIVGHEAQGVSRSYLIEPATVGTPASILGYRIAPSDRTTVEFLLLLPAATLLVCVLRNLVGLNSFGAFAPALLGLSFREVESVAGLFVVLTIVTCGWWLRRGLNDLHLLQAPRTALLLTCIVILLLAIIIALGGDGPRVVALFPLVILTGLIERFWSMDEEDGAANSLSVLASTFFIAACVWLLAVIPALPAWMMRHPETLGVIMACQLLLGRFTGFRLLEIYRFRSMIDQPNSHVQQYSTARASRAA